MYDPRQGTRRGGGDDERYVDGGRKAFDRPFLEKVARAGGGAGGVRGNAPRTSGMHQQTIIAPHERQEQAPSYSNFVPNVKYAPTQNRPTA